MDRRFRSNVFLIMVVFILMINIGLVLGASILDNALKPIGNINIATTYAQYPQLIDTIFYMFFFIVLSIAILGRVDMFKESKTVPIVVGVALAISMSVTAYYMHILFFRDIAPIALLIMAGVFGALAYNALKSWHWDEFLAAGVTILLIVMILGIGKFTPGVSSSGSSVNQSSLFGEINGWASIIALICIPTGLWRTWSKRRSDSPSGSESRDENIFFRRQKNAIDAAKELEKDAAKKSKRNEVELDVVKGQEEIQSMGEDQNVVSAEASKFATQLEQSKQNELNGEQKEATIFTAINALLDDMDKTLGQINDVEKFDQTAKRYMIQHLQGVAQECMQVTLNQKELSISRKKLVNDLNEDVKKIDDVVRKFSLIDARLNSIQGKLSEDLNAEITKLVNKKKIDAKTRETMRSGVDTYIKNFGGIISDIKAILKDMKVSDRTIDSQDEKTLFDVKKIDASIKKMEAASQRLYKDMMALNNPNNKIEDIPRKATENTQKIFSQLLENQKILLQFYKDDVMLFIKDMRIAINNSSRLTDPVNKIQSSINQVQVAYTTLQNEANKAIGKEYTDVQVSKNITDITSYATKIVQSETQARTTIDNQTRNNLDKLQRDIEFEMNGITVEMGKIQDNEKKVLIGLTKALDIIIKHKSKIDEQFKTDATKFSAEMNQATQTIISGRNAA